MRLLTASLVVATALAASPMVQRVEGQGRLKPTEPGTHGDPAWQRTLRLADGRTFVTDGGLALDAAVAKPNSLPTERLPDASAKVLEGYLTASPKDEYRFDQLKDDASGKTYTAPNGIPLNATYINYLRRVLSPSTLRFRMEGALTPVVIISDGKRVGVLMPVAK